LYRLSDIKVNQNLKLSWWLTNSALHHEDIKGSGCTDPHFLDLGISWRVSVQLHAAAALPPGKRPPLSIGFEVGWALELVWMMWGRENS
jgi:hypothetical protein